MRGAVLGIRFLLELCLLGALAAGGWALAGGGVLGVVLTVAAAVAGAAVWGMWIGPRSARRLPDPARLALEVALYVLGGIGLWAVSSAAAGAAFTAAAVVVAVLTRVVGEPAPSA